MLLFAIFGIRVLRTTRFQTLVARTVLIDTAVERRRNDTGICLSKCRLHLTIEPNLRLNRCTPVKRRFGG